MKPTDDERVAADVVGEWCASRGLEVERVRWRTDVLELTLKDDTAVSVESVVAAFEELKTLSGARWVTVWAGGS